jgi:hypothetical protein
MKLVIIQLYLTSCHFISPWTKYSPELHVFKHLQSLLVPKFQRSSCTLVQNHGQNLVLGIPICMYLDSGLKFLN